MVQIIKVLGYRKDIQPAFFQTPDLYEHRIAVIALVDCLNNIFRSHQSVSQLRNKNFGVGEIYIRRFFVHEPPIRELVYQCFPSCVFNLQNFLDPITLQRLQESRSDDDCFVFVQMFANLTDDFRIKLRMFGKKNCPAVVGKFRIQIHWYTNHPNVVMNIHFTRRMIGFIRGNAIRFTEFSEKGIQFIECIPGNLSNRAEHFCFPVRRIYRLDQASIAPMDDCLWFGEQSILKLFSVPV